MGPSIGCRSQEVVASRSSAARRASPRLHGRRSPPTSPPGAGRCARPAGRCGSGAPERSSSAGELMAPPATTTWPATMRVRGASAVPLALTPTQSSATTRWPCHARGVAARVSTSSVAPRSSAAGIVVTSIDCLALVGQPRPHEPRFQQPLTLRRIAAAGMPSSQRAACAAGRCSRSAAPARGRCSAAARPAGTTGASRSSV